MTRNTRESLAKKVASIGTPEAKGLAEFVVKKRSGGETPCWGAIADHLREHVTSDAAFESLWTAMVEAREPRAQLVLLSAIKGNPRLVAFATKDFASVSPVVRQALSALCDPNDVEANRGFETRVNELTATRYVPDSVAPLHESQRRSK